MTKRWNISNFKKMVGIKIKRKYYIGFFYFIGLADVGIVKFANEGVLHTKLWIVDRKHFYVGSANMGWPSSSPSSWTGGRA